MKWKIATILQTLFPFSLFCIFLLVFNTSCTNYSAANVESSVHPPVPKPRVEAGNADRILENAYRMVAADDKESISADGGKKQKNNSDDHDQEINIDAMQSLEFVRALVLEFSPEHRFLIQQSFARIALDTSQQFSLMDAVALAVQLNRDIKTSYAQYQQTLGSLEVARGEFDITLKTGWNYTPSYSLGEGEHIDETDTNIGTLNLSTLSRFGLQTDATFSFTGTDFSTGSSVGELGKRDASLVFSLPLLKNFGTISAGAGEQSSLVELEASLSNVLHQMTLSLNTVVGSYWSYMDAVQKLLLSIDALDRSSSTLRDTEVLVENSFQAKTDLLSLRADVSTKTSSKLYNEQQVVVARNKLAFDLGFSVQDSSRLPMPTTDFFEVDVTLARHILENEPLLFETALAKRHDYKSSELKVKSSKILEEKYRNDIYPSVDMMFGVTHSDFARTSSYNDMVGGSYEGDTGVQVGVQVELPWTNEVARGQFRSQVGATRELALAYSTSKESLSGEIDDAVNALFYAVEILAALEEAEKNFAQAREDEFEKFKLGLSSIFDVLNATDKLNTSRTTTVSARATLATAISTIRYATGTLIDQQSSETILKIEDFSTPLPPTLLQ